MAGVRKNLNEKLHTHYEGRSIGAPDSGDETALAGCQAHYRSANRRAPPASTAMTMELWRPWIQSRAGALLEKMQGTEGDQQALPRWQESLSVR